MHILDRQDEATVCIATSYTYTVHVYIIRIQNDKMAGIFYMVKKSCMCTDERHGGGCIDVWYNGSSLENGFKHTLKIHSYPREIGAGGSI